MHGQTPHNVPVISTDEQFGPSEIQLIRAAIDLGALAFGGPLSPSEQALANLASLAQSLPDAVEALRDAILRGGDPLGEAFCAVRPGSRRRLRGAFYTPREIVTAMVNWVLNQSPDRLVDAGCGSGRFVTQALRHNPKLEVVAIDIDPLATLLTRAALASFNNKTAIVINDDFTTVKLPQHSGITAFVSNPPYVRHHDLLPSAKAWAASAALALGERVSGLSGLHAHFFLATAHHGRRGDIGCFVTSAEWLDVNYGSIIRRLLTSHLGMQSLHVLDHSSTPFADAMSTAAICCFAFGKSTESVRTAYVDDLASLGDLRSGMVLATSALRAAERWSPLIRQREKPESTKSGVLGDIARVHRGVATGANDFFVLTKERAESLGILQWCYPTVAHAAEIIGAGGIVRDDPQRRVLLAVPPDVDRRAFPALDAYLRFGEQATGDAPPVAARYLPSHRHPWWYLGKLPKPPVIASYMARCAPVFALNPDKLTILNIAHGLYPLRETSSGQLVSLVQNLNDRRELFRGSGRTYQGGLEKFEPREMEQLPIQLEEVPAHGS